jgi:hypothetical protein
MILAGWHFGQNVDAVVGEVTLVIGATIVVVGIAAWLLRRHRSSSAGKAGGDLVV